VQVRASPVRASPGQVLLPVAVLGQNTWGQFVSPLFKSIRNPKPRSCPWDTWVMHRRELPPGRGAAAESPRSVKAPVRRDRGPRPRPGLLAWTWVLLCLGKFLECRCGKFRARPSSLSPRECFIFCYLQQLVTHNSGALLPPVLFSSFQTSRNLSGAECNALKGTVPLGMC
jgi:hypothetical protein